MSEQFLWDAAGCRGYSGFDRSDWRLRRDDAPEATTRGTMTWPVGRPRSCDRTFLERWAMACRWDERCVTM